MMRCTIQAVVFAAALAVCLRQAFAQEAASALTWPQWRGPTRDCQAPGGKPLPSQLSGDAFQERWRAPLGPSYSGPVVSETMVFATETQDGKREVVRAFDRATGRQQWETAWDGSLSVPFFAKANGDWIRSTPAYDGECLYVAGMRDVLVCLDAQTGAVRWRFDFVEELESPLPAFGFVCSPLVDGEHVYVQAGAGICKLEKSTGELLWRALVDEGGMWGSAFSSPILANLAHQRQLLVQTREKLAGLDPVTGKELWSHAIPAFRGMNILTPTVVRDAVFTSSYGGKSLLLEVTSERGEWAVAEAWTNKVTGYMSSPVVVDEHLYLHLQNQRFTCLELKTGKSCWTTKPFGKYWSMAVSGDRILALDERGELLLIAANPAAFELLDSRKVSDDPTWAHVAVCGDEVFIRELNSLVAYRWGQRPSPSAQGVLERVEPTP